MLTDLPTDLHLLILDHDTEKQHLRSENQRLVNEVNSALRKAIDLQDRVIYYLKQLVIAMDALEIGPPTEYPGDDP
jgi:hypothetical protein